GKYKVYIIDEVHMMTPAAFNALLKTLEEPPSHVIFILATTEPHKILPTILSRCQRFDFSKVDDHSLKNRLINVLKQENVSYEDTALDLIVSLADGGVRDALSLLDQTIAYSGNNIKLQDIQDIFGLLSVSEKIDLLKNINNGDIKYVLNKTNSLIENGIDIIRLTQDLLDILKDIIIYNRSLCSDILVSLNEEQAKVLCQKISTNNALDYINVLLKAQSQYKVVANVKSLFEMTILQLTTQNNNNNDYVKLEPKPIKTLDEYEAKESFIQKPEPILKKIDKEVPSKINKESSTTQESKEKQTTFLDSKLEIQGDELPPFMIDDPVLNENGSDSSIEPLKLAGTPNFIDDDDIIKLMVLGSKDEKQRLLNIWDNALSQYIFDNKYGKYADILRSGKPTILTKEYLILV
ncbi:MAG: DNA polymerase III subunit gamma/tau, partial [Bacilli bacterium]|nr:DNA polymerase III subunit gamma/tau [Bacilli bacterium]